MPSESVLTRRKRKRAWYHANKEKEQARSREYQRSNRARSLLGRAEHRAFHKQLEIDLDIEWIQEALDDGYCQVTNIPFSITPGPRGPWTPSLDRTDSPKGYTKDNCKVVCWIYNAAKSEFRHEDVVVFCEQILDTEEKKNGN